MSDYIVISVDAPATTANLGAGYDCLALGLDWWNQFYVVVRRSGIVVEPLVRLDIDWTTFGRQDDLITNPVTNVFVKSFKSTVEYLADATKLGLPPLNMFFGSRVNLPTERGLGSSSSACVAGTVAGFEFLKWYRSEAEVSRRLQHSCDTTIENDRQRRDLLASLARRHDTCPDNICAALSGGLTSVFVDSGTGRSRFSEELHYFSYPIDDPSLKCAVTIFNHGISTPTARGALESTNYRIDDAAFNVSRSTCLPAALTSRRYEFLDQLTKDRLHQGQRAGLYPIDLDLLSDAAMEEGAYCTFISGAGSTLATLASQTNAEKAIEAIAGRFDELISEGRARDSGWSIADSRVLDLSLQGAESRAKVVEVPERRVAELLDSDHLATCVSAWFKELAASGQAYRPTEKELQTAVPEDTIAKEKPEPELDLFVVELLSDELVGVSEQVFNELPAAEQALFNRLSGEMQIRIAGKAVELRAASDRLPPGSPTQRRLQAAISQYLQELVRQPDSPALAGAVAKLATHVEELARGMLDVLAKSVYPKDAGRAQTELKLPSRKILTMSLGKVAVALHTAQKHPDFVHYSTILDDANVSGLLAFSEIRNLWMYEAVSGSASVLMNSAGGAILDGAELVEWLLRSRSELAEMEGGSNAAVDLEAGAANFFISHASEDKEAIARPLYEELSGRGYKVWLDEAELTVGDSLRQRIDEAISSCQFGIVVLSDAFFRKDWPQEELNALFTRQLSGVKTILPIWHDVDQARVLQYSPLLADRLAARSSDGVEEVVRQVLAAFDAEIRRRKR
ncbi:TIR domain-containing protein [Candidatus Microthrix parvicella]|uniref:TIR domain-containing protein n=1 Tax=Candidatus Neomicrothrix parvicella TaxID=41950 RepID=UPI0004BC697A|nr:TIR domain-containing protein [Candidatus Microthrix parvicella]